jgi:lipid-A-disaccharide synthase
MTEGQAATHERPRGGDGTLVVVAGEASGDLHGARLVRSLRALAPDLRILGMGGAAMREAGVELVADAGETAVVGITELWEKRRVLRAALERLRSRLRVERPDLLICIDFPDFNLLLAKSAKRLGVPVCYFISPQIWAWRRWRLHTIRRLVRRMLVLFPFEEALYREAGVDVRFVGHPLLDALADVPAASVCRASLGLPPSAEVLCLLPGSRGAELRRHLPILLGAAERIRTARPGVELLLALAPTLDESAVRASVAASGLPVRLVRSDTARAIRAADLVLAVSGTVTLETAILGTPMIITYRVGTLTYLLVRPLISVRFVGLPNLVAGRGVVPELLQQDATPERLAVEALSLLAAPERLQAMRAALVEVRSRLGERGAADRAAREILGLLAEGAAGEGGP